MGVGHAACYTGRGTCRWWVNTPDCVFGTRAPRLRLWDLFSQDEERPREEVQVSYTVGMSVLP